MFSTNVHLTMKPRLAIYALLLMLVVLVLVLARPFSRWPTGQGTARQQGVSEPPSAGRRGSDPAASKRSRAAPSEAARAGPAPTSNTSEEERRAIASREWVESQNVPVRFYGIVIDQDSNALSGVRVQLGLGHNAYLIPNSLEAAQSAALTADELQKLLSPTIEALTDGSGQFEWTDPNVTGDVLGIGLITKEGYEVEPGPRSFPLAAAGPRSP